MKQTMAYTTSKEIGFAGANSLRNKHKKVKKTGMAKSEIDAKNAFGKDHPLYETLGGAKCIRKNLLAARKAKNLNSFINADYRFVKPKELNRERLTRTLLYTHYNLYLESNDIKDGDLGGEGRKIFKNDWGMGPYYVYDNNYAKKEGYVPDYDDQSFVDRRINSSLNNTTGTNN